MKSITKEKYECLIASSVKKFSPFKVSSTFKGLTETITRQRVLLKPGGRIEFLFQLDSSYHPAYGIEDSTIYFRTKLVCFAKAILEGLIAKEELRPLNKRA